MEVREAALVHSIYTDRLGAREARLRLPRAAMVPLWGQLQLSPGARGPGAVELAVVVKVLARPPMVERRQARLVVRPAALRRGRLQAAALAV